MTKDSTVYLCHIRDCLEKIRRFTKDGKSGFLQDEMVQDAVIRNLEVIGQAVKDFGTEQLSSGYPAIPWAQIAGTRNILAHQYLGVDIDLIWNIVEQELPLLESAITALLHESEQKTEPDVSRQ